MVWEPILATDWVGPRPLALGRVGDPRAVQFWDQRNQLSGLMGGPPRFQDKPAYQVLFDMGDTIWDFVAVYPPGVAWNGGAAQPSFAGGAVVKVIEGLRTAIPR